jgi:DNA-directed RNA polymerase subunit M/transcription elongation factor TFIIS
MHCPSCGQDESVYVEPGCLSVDGELLTFKVCRNCDYGINEHTEGECDCEKG